MAEKRSRNYAAEYQRRNDLAKQRGFKSYGQQRHYVEYTGTPVKYIQTVEPEEIASSYERTQYNYDDYNWGDDKLLDAWIRRSQGRGVSEEDAFLSYKRAARGGSLSREQIRRLSRQEYGQDWNEQWDTSN
jgi:hypothetical protein